MRKAFYAISFEVERLQEGIWHAVTAANGEAKHTIRLHNIASANQSGGLGNAAKSSSNSGHSSFRLNSVSRGA